MPTAFQSSGFQNSGFQTLPGKKKKSGKPNAKRKTYVFGKHKFDFTPAELDAHLEELLRESPQQPPPVELEDRPLPKHDRALAIVAPAYPDLKAMFAAAGQIEAAQRLRQVALRMALAEDEREVEMLLLG